MANYEKIRKDGSKVSGDTGVTSIGNYIAAKISKGQFVEGEVISFPHSFHKLVVTHEGDSVSFITNEKGNPNWFSLNIANALNKTAQKNKVILC